MEASAVRRATVAAAVEFCDMTKRRPARVWARQIELRIPVHERIAGTTKMWPRRSMML